MRVYLWFGEKKEKGKGGRIDRGLHDRRRKKVDGENWQGSTVSRAIISSSKFDDIIRAPDRHNNCWPPPPCKARNGGHFHVPSSACTSRLSIGKIGYCENPRWLYVRCSINFRIGAREGYIYIYIGIFLWGLVSIDLWFWNSFELAGEVFLLLYF